MPFGLPKKLKIQWIEDKKRRQVTLHKRRATLLEKAKELATLCDVAVAVIVYGYGEAVPSTFPSPAVAKEILERYVALPDMKKGNINIEAFLRERIKKVTKSLGKLKHGNRNRSVELILNEIHLGRRHNLDDLTPELAEAVKSLYMARMKLVGGCIKSPVSQATAAAAAAADAAIMSGTQESLVAPVVTDAPAPDVTAPLAVAPVVADTPAAPLALDPFDLDGPPRHGSFLLMMAEAIVDDGSGREFVPTATDVERLLMEHGFHGLFQRQ